MPHKSLLYYINPSSIHSCNFSQPLQPIKGHPSQVFLSIPKQSSVPENLQVDSKPRQPFSISIGSGSSK